MKRILLRMRIVVPVILILILTAGTADAQRLSPGPQDLSFFSAVDDTDQPYSVYIPDNFDESKHYPLVVFLHGAWSNHRLGMRRLFGVGNSQGYDFIKPGNVPLETDVEASRYWPPFRIWGAMAICVMALVRPAPWITWHWPPAISFSATPRIRRQSKSRFSRSRCVFSKTLPLP